jgi:hypothetical protein
MIDDDVITRLVELHDHIKAPDTHPDADVFCGQQLLRRRRTVVVGAVAAAVVAVLGVVAATAGVPRAADHLVPSRPSPTVPTDEQWPLAQIRLQGRVDHEQHQSGGLSVRTFVLCDGSPECSPGTDGPIRRRHEHRALEVTQNGRSAMFRIGNSAMTVVTGYDDATLLVMDPLPGAADFFDPIQNGFRLVRADGTEIGLRVESDRAPAAPGPGVVLVNHYAVDPDSDSIESQLVLAVDANERTVRALDLPQNLDLRRTWGPNLDQSLWFVTSSCDVYSWTPTGMLQHRGGGCASSFDPGHYRTDANGDLTDQFGNRGNGDVTWVNGDWFPEGWLATPGRMAFLERDFVGRNDSRLTLHVTLDHGATWQTVPVRDEAAIPGVLGLIG